MHIRVNGHPPEQDRSEEHTSELQSLTNLVCRLLLEKKKKQSASRERSRVQSSSTRRHGHTMTSDCHLNSPRQAAYILIWLRVRRRASDVPDSVHTLLP